MDNLENKLIEENKLKEKEELEELEMYENSRGFLVSAMTGLISGFAIDSPHSIELNRYNILNISAFSGLTLPFLLQYDTKDNESFSKTLKRNPYFFAGMMTGLVFSKTIKSYLF